MIAATSDQARDEVVWSNIANTLTGTGTAIGTEQQNTNDIVNQAGCTSGVHIFVITWKKAAWCPVKRGKFTPEELAHIDLTNVPKDLRTVFKVKDLYVAGLEDDCTRLTYSEILKDKKASTLTYFMARALSWFKQIYHFEFEKVLSDNGLEFKGSLDREHPFEMMCEQLGVKHIYIRPYRPHY